MILYAPNVNTGGGYVLLQSILAAWPSGEPLEAMLDERVRTRLTLPANMQVHWVRPAVMSRLMAERALYRAATGDHAVLCFHGLPPLLPLRGRVVVFQQNRLLFGLTPLTGFRPKTALRIAGERLVSRWFRHRVSTYVVQTPTMARDLTHWYGGPVPPDVQVFPFMDPLHHGPALSPAQAEWDFVYVADGEAHKNHLRLIEAWRELALLGMKPTLALTLGPRDHLLNQQVTAVREECGAKIVNLGQMPLEKVLELYGKSRALIFPSLSESFGLPLIEAQLIGLPILAPELDYVRDVCVPIQTFDPHSSHSITRAVRRFLAQPEPTVALNLPAALWASLSAARAACGSLPETSID